jgi:hypothetical protein
MTYSNPQLATFERERIAILAALQTLMLNGVASSSSLANRKAREYMTHGVGRRLSVIRRCIEKIFCLFPPSQTRPLDRETLADVQIYLHAFVINLYGVFDCWAWAFVLRHDLLQKIGRRNNVGLFKKETQQYLPSALLDYLRSDRIRTWYETYVTGYRDALAHRIPLYIPPANWTTQDSELYSRLEDEKVACIRDGQWERLDQIWVEQEDIGTACLAFMHEYSADSDARPLLLHGQLLCDGMSVVEFGRLYLSAWHVCVEDSSVRT